MQRTRGLTENTWHAQKKTFKRSEEMSHQELRTSTRLRVQRYRLALMRQRAAHRRQQETDERRYMYNCIII